LQLPLSRGGLLGTAAGESAEHNSSLVLHEMNDLVTLQFGNDNKLTTAKRNEEFNVETDANICARFLSNIL